MSESAARVTAAVLLRRPIKTCPEARRGVISFGQGGFAVNRRAPCVSERVRFRLSRAQPVTGPGKFAPDGKCWVNVPPGVDTGFRSV